MKDIKSINQLLCICSLPIVLLTGCNKSQTGLLEVDPQMVFEIIHPAQTRATATQFETADQIGLFITESSEPLQLSGNYINNALLTYNGSAWTPSNPVYYNNGTYNVYAYYPYTVNPTSVDDYEYEVATDQTTSTVGSTLGGYEASDFLWASQSEVVASALPIPLKFSHRMSRIIIRLIKGEDYDGEIPTDAKVYIHSTILSATIDLSVGIPTVNPYGKSSTIRARNEGGARYSAIIVPQRLVNRLPLIEVVMKDVSYIMESTFVFKPGMQHTVSLIISKNPEQVKIEIGGEIENWE